MGETSRAGLGARLRESETATLLGQSGFRRFYAGAMVSRAGDALYFVAAMWLVYDLTGSTLFTGLAVTLSRLPSIGSVFIGPLVDRADLDRLLPTAEVLQGLVVLVVPVAAALGHLSVWLVLGVIGVAATLRRVSAPAEQAVLPRVVDRGLIARANSLAASTKQALGAAAEASSGLLIAVVGAVSLFLVDVATFAASAVLFAALQVPPGDGGATEGDEEGGGVPSLSEYVADIREGVATIRKSVLLHALAGAVLASAVTGLATPVLPAFGDAIGGAGAYGLLVASATGGTLVGSAVAARFEDRPFGGVVIAGFLVAAVGRASAAVLESPLLVFVGFGLAAVPLGVYNVLVSTVVQVGVPDRLLARVSSTNGTLIALVAPLGLLAGGALGTVLPAGVVVGLSAGGYLLIAGYWLVVPDLRSFGPVSGVESGAFDPAG